MSEQTSIDDGGPAFPMPASDALNAFGEMDGNAHQVGMSLRAYLAGQALAGLCGAPLLCECPAEQKARWVVDAADATLVRLRGGPTPPDRTYEQTIEACVLALWPQTGEPLMPEVVEQLPGEVRAMARHIRNLLDIIHDDLTHERQRDHAEAIEAAMKAVGR